MININSITWSGDIFFYVDIFFSKICKKKSALMSYENVYLIYNSNLVLFLSISGRYILSYLEFYRGKNVIIRLNLNVLI